MFKTWSKSFAWSTQVDTLRSLREGLSEPDPLGKRSAAPCTLSEIATALVYSSLVGPDGGREVDEALCTTPVSRRLWGYIMDAAPIFDDCTSRHAR